MRAVMFNIGKALEALAFASFLPGIIWLGVSMFVMHESELKYGRFNGLFAFWQFHDVMKKNYPDISRFGRGLFFATLALQAPWLVGKLIGVC